MACSRKGRARSQRERLADASHRGPRATADCTGSTAQLQSDEIPYVQAVYGMSDLIMRRVLAPWLMSDFIFGMTSHGPRWNAYIRQLVGKPSAPALVVGSRRGLPGPLITRTDAPHAHFGDACGGRWLRIPSKGFVHDAIRKRRDVLASRQSGAAPKDPKADRPVFLDLMLTATDADGKPFSDEDIEEETSTFMFEGHGAPCACTAAAHTERAMLTPTTQRCSRGHPGQIRPRPRWRGQCS